MTFTSALFLMAAAFAGPEQAESAAIDVESVVVTLIEEVDVPARETDVLASVNAREGQFVKENDLLAQIDDAEAALALKRAEVDVEIAREKAGNDISVRFARKKLEVAGNEVRRARESRAKLKGSVSDTEFDRLKLLEQESTLQIEQAEHELKTEKLNLKLKQRDLEIAQRDVERRKILAPISGIVVQVNQHKGEWVQPGKAVFRILRVNRLRAEGFLYAKDVSGEMTGRAAILKIPTIGTEGREFPGKVVFVSPEINPVNNQIRFWAEFENPKLELRPGMRGSLTIQPAAATEAKNPAEPIKAPQPKPDEN